jgi:excisionase family DNA binding protein
MSPVEAVPIREAAKRLGVHENTIRNWADRRVIRSHRLPSGIRRIPRSEIERLEHEIFAVPASFADERVVAAPTPIVEEVHPSRYPDS